MKLRLLILGIIFYGNLLSQNQPVNIELNRGRLWHSFHFGQECDVMHDWQRSSPGLDWPGFDPNEIKQAFGASYTHLLAAGFYITSLNDTGAVQGWDNFATNGADAVGWQGGDKRYLVQNHGKRWSQGENYWLQTDPNEAEEVIETYFEKNPEWYQPWDNQNQWIGVKREVRQWSGSRADEDYVIVDYTIYNTKSRKGVDGIYLLFSYALSPNVRGWSLSNPNYPSGARNTQSRWDADSLTLISWAGDFSATSNWDESFDLFSSTVYDPVLGEDIVESEYLAPGFMGIRFLYISPDSSGLENQINGFSWSAAAPSGDHSGPFLGVLGLDNKYDAMADPSLLSNAFDDHSDARMGDSRLYANFSLGPFDVPRNDSIRIVVAEFVGGASYEDARNPAFTLADVQAAGDSASIYLQDRVRFNFEHGYRVPMPPTPPEFRVSPGTEAGIVANVISFDEVAETIQDPHEGIIDIAGYRIYRSGDLPFGPWELIADIPVGDPSFWNADSQLYQMMDDQVALGYGYYYSVTAYDTGHSSWSVDPSVVVPSLESSIFANRRKTAFYTTVWPQNGDLSQVVVVPNPFYRSSGFELAGDTKAIQFVNLSQDCTIRIFSVRGDLVKSLQHLSDNSGTAFWNQISDNGQYVKSGMYFYHIEDVGGSQTTGKFAIVN